MVNNSLARIKLSKTQLSKIGQSAGFVGRLLAPLLRNVLPLMKYVLKPWKAKSVLIPLGLTAPPSTTDAAIQKKTFEYGMTALVISNDQMNDIMKIVKSLEESGLLIRGVSETIKNQTK